MPFLWQIFFKISWDYLRLIERLSERLTLKVVE